MGRGGGILLIYYMHVKDDYDGKREMMIMIFHYWPLPFLCLMFGGRKAATAW